MTTLAEFREQALKNYEATRQKRHAEVERRNAVILQALDAWGIRSEAAPDDEGFYLNTGYYTHGVSVHHPELSQTVTLLLAGDGSKSLYLLGRRDPLEDVFQVLQAMNNGAPLRYTPDQEHSE